MVKPVDDKPWYQRAFSAKYTEVYSHRSELAAQREVRWLRTLLKGSKPRHVLDLCCGAGRHVLQWYGQAERITGFDLSMELLQKAQDKKAAGDISLVRGDMRELPFRPNSFDLVTSFFTSFGYFANDQEDYRVISEISRVLENSGKLLLDFLNADYVRETLIPEGLDEKDGKVILQQRRISADGKRVLKTIQYEEPGQETEHYEESVRLYSSEELQSLLESQGLRILQRFGSLHGDNAHVSKPRTVLWAEKVS